MALYDKLKLCISFVSLSLMLMNSPHQILCYSMCLFVYYYLLHYTDDIDHSGSGNEETSSEPLPKMDESISCKSKGML